MDSAEEEDIQVTKDISHLTRILSPKDLDPAVMFSLKRNIRSCRRLATITATGSSVIERLNRVQMPE